MKMMLKSELIGFVSLTALLRVGIVGMLIDKLSAGSTNLLCFLLGDGTVLTIRARITEVEPWHEVGTLVLEHIANLGKADALYTPLPSSWLKTGPVEKLILDSKKFIAESGFFIGNQAGEEIIILPGAFPYSVEINAPFYSGIFDPEHEVDEYEHMPEVAPV